MLRKEDVSEDTAQRVEGYVEGQWGYRLDIFALLKTKTVPLSGARNIAMCIDRDNGYEAWRTSTLRFEPQVGIRSMEKVSELTQLQNKRCKHAAETVLILLEVDRRKRLIDEIGGQEPSNDTLVSTSPVSRT